MAEIISIVGIISVAVQPSTPNTNNERRLWDESALIPASEKRRGRKFCDNQKGMKLKFLKEFVHIDLMKFT